LALPTEVRILSPPFWQHHRLRRDLRCRDEPLAPVADEDEQVLVAARIERLDSARPTAVAALGRRRDLVAVVSQGGRSLHLDAQQAVVALGDQVGVRAMAERDPDPEPSAGQPGDCGSLTDVALAPWIGLAQSGMAEGCLGRQTENHLAQGHSFVAFRRGTPSADGRSIFRRTILAVS
jgi:hypothetical protein